MLCCTSVKRHYRSVGYGNGGGCTGLCQAEALHHRAAEADLQELLHMVGQGRPSRHDESDLAPQAGLDFAEDELVEEWGGLHSEQACQWPAA